jgi:hypothetical protein
MHVKSTCYKIKIFTFEFVHFCQTWIFIPDHREIINEMSKLIRDYNIINDIGIFQFSVLVPAFKFRSDLKS